MVEYPIMMMNLAVSKPCFTSFCGWFLEVPLRKLKFLLVLMCFLTKKKNTILLFINQLTMILLSLFVSVAVLFVEEEDYDVVDNHSTNPSGIPTNRLNIMLMS